MMKPAILTVLVLALALTRSIPSHAQSSGPPHTPAPSAGVQPNQGSYDVYDADTPPKDTGVDAHVLNDGQQMEADGVFYFWNQLKGRYESYGGTHSCYFYAGVDMEYSFKHYGPTGSLVGSGTIKPQ